MKVLYNAGSMFNEAQVNQRKIEGVNLREHLNDFKIANPIDFETNLGVCPTPKAIWEADYKAIKEADYMIFELDSLDHGMIAELGIAMEMAKTTQHHKVLVGVISDFRFYQKSSIFQFNEFGMNHFVFGQLFDQQLNDEKRIILVSSHNDAIEVVKNYEQYLATKDDKFLILNDKLDKKFIYDNGQMFSQ